MEFYYLLKKIQRGEEWCVVGDFNEVLRKEEIVGEGVPRFTKGMEEFRCFVNQMELIDLNYVGGKFTWFKDNGKALSRIDRFLLSKKFIEEWEVGEQMIDKRDFSDHSPIWLGVGKLDWGPKPFRFNNAWFKHEGFKAFLEVERKKLIVTGRGNFVLYEKLKSFKEKLKGWNKEVFGWVDLKMEEARDSINMLDMVIEDNMGGNNEVAVQARRNVSVDLWNGMHLKECMLRLKSRNLWLKEGDRNTKFFHNSFKERQRRNSITSLEGEEGRVKGVANIKEEIRGYFQNFFKEEDFARPVPEGLCFKRLEESEVVWLERDFSEVEIKEAVWSCDGDKSPGPDGYSMDFFKLN
ncbi:uncharacterized protein LOC131614074 [Vicia villosa]|uniref:uncharacterized protein LOC131614074 n=1 Tax=Vicia villosa TaxID=3911 RepID=UPI00273CEF8E|nr:uncharacterized protein LOC131614074 [Vicia villosa]